MLKNALNVGILMHKSKIIYVWADNKMTCFANLKSF